MDNDGINEVKQSSSGDEGALCAGNNYLLEEQGNDNQVIIEHFKIEDTFYVESRKKVLLKLGATKHYFYQVISPLI